MAYSAMFFGKTSMAPSRSIATGYQNGTLATILMARPVSVDANGRIELTDVSNEDSVKRMIGITTENIPSGATGQVYSDGRAQSLGAQMASFAIGDAIYVGKNGILTNAKPDYGVAGFVAEDFIVFVGVVVKNEFDPGEKDIQLMLGIVGQL